MAESPMILFIRYQTTTVSIRCVHLFLFGYIGTKVQLSTLDRWTWLQMFTRFRSREIAFQLERRRINCNIGFFSSIIPDGFDLSLIKYIHYNYCYLLPMLFKSSYGSDKPNYAHDADQEKHFQEIIIKYMTRWSKPLCFNYWQPSTSFIYQL